MSVSLTLLFLMKGQQSGTDRRSRTLLQKPATYLMGTVPPVAADSFQLKTWKIKKFIVNGAAVEKRRNASDSPQSPCHSGELQGMLQGQASHFT